MTVRFNGAWWVLAFALVGGCSDRDESSVVPPQPTIDNGVAEPRPVFHLMPEDLATGVRGTPPTIIVGTELSESDVRAMGRALSLVRWPSRAPIQATVHHEAPDAAEGRTTHRFWLEPIADAAAERNDNWVALVLDGSALPAQLARNVDARADTWPGHLIHRFSRARSTIVDRVDVESDGQRTHIGIGLSARVRDDAGALARISVSSGGVPVICIALNDGDLQDEDGTRTITLDCPSHELFSVRVSEWLTALDGVALGDAYGAAVELDVTRDPVQRRYEIERQLAAVWD